MIEQVTRVDGQIALFLEMETGLMAERLAKSQEVSVQDILLALLRLYSADARIGDDQRIGSGAFADAVDDLSLRNLQVPVERDWAALFESDSEEIFTDCLDAHAYSRFNRGFPVNDDLDLSSEFVNARLSALIESCISACRMSDRYSNILLEILKGHSPFLDAKLEWWQKWLAMKRKSDTPEKMQKYFITLHAGKIADLTEDELNSLFRRRSELNESIDGLEAAVETNEAMVDRAYAAVNASVDGSDLIDEDHMAALQTTQQLYMDAFIAYTSAIDELSFIQRRFQRIEDSGSHEQTLADATKDV